MSHKMRVNGHPLQRAVGLVEYVSRTRDSDIFDEKTCFEMKQKWLLIVPPILIIFLFMNFLTEYRNCLKPKMKLKVQ